MSTHFTVVFERPEGYEDVHPQLCAEDHIIDYPGMKWEAADGNLIRRCDELAEALEMAERALNECCGITLNSRAVADKIRAALAKHRQPQEAPELFPGTLEKLRGLGRDKS